jgi:hypothetical protein
MFTSSNNTLFPKESDTLFTEIIAAPKLRREGTILSGGKGVLNVNIVTGEAASY